MAKIGWILEKFNFFSKRQKEPLIPYAPPAPLQYTPFEQELQKAFAQHRKNPKNMALIVKLVPDDSGKMFFFDEAKKSSVRCRYEFGSIPHGKNPYREIEDLDWRGEHVMMAFELKQPSIPYQFPDWLAGTIHRPSSFFHKPAICLPPKEMYEIAQDVFLQFTKDAKALAQETREQGRPRLRLVTVNGLNIA